MALPVEPSKATVDLVDLWKRYGGDRSTIWTNLSQMSPSDQALFMSKLTSQWPYDMERRALSWPMHVGLLTNCLTAALISTRINADMVLLEPKTPFLDAVKRCPKAPFVFGIYSAGLTYYVMQQMTVNSALYKEDEPCTSCLLTETIGISLFTGLIMPMVATPYLSYYVLLQRQNEKFPVIKNMLDFAMLSIEGSRAARPLLLTLVPLQVAVAAFGLYATLWGRQRLFNTLDADPELAKELLVSVQSKPSLKQRVVDFLRKIPVISDIVRHDGPENERVA